jgi:hypothetical protein
MYLVLGRNLNIFKKEMIISEFLESSNFFENLGLPFNALFQNFLELSMDCSLNDILP